MSEYVMPNGTINTNCIKVNIEENTLTAFDIWAEGFLDQGMEGVPTKARYVGKEYGLNFADACERYYRKHSTPEDFNRYFFIADDGTPCYWVRLFDNEDDARKAFG